jgi:hypothetical protein
MFTSKIGKSFLLAFLIAILLWVNPLPAIANSAEPPSIIIIVPNAPKDLEIRLGPQNMEARRTDKTIESYFTFYNYELRGTDNTVRVTTGGKAFEATLGDSLMQYNNMFTLDLKKQTLTPGKSQSRSIALLSIRIILTLAIEGLVFYLFGYRKRNSWLIFLVVNLITQALLFNWLAQSSPFSSYIILNLVFGEALVFIVEMIAFLVFVNEQARWRTGLYVILANLVSLIAGGFLITLLPVY